MADTGSSPETSAAVTSNDTAAASSSSSIFRRPNASFLTRTKAFEKLAKTAFQAIDNDKTGQLGKAELYAGILLVHVKLAKYAGPAACYPPTKAVIDQLFDAADENKSGTIDEREFIQIMIICCAQIASRMAVYYAIIILLVPFLASHIIDGLVSLDDYWQLNTKEHGGLQSFFSLFEKLLTFNDLAEHAVSLLLFFFVVPLFFNYIDTSSEQAAIRVTVNDNKEKDKAE